MRRDLHQSALAVILAIGLLAAWSPGFAVEPGLDIAVPRVAITNAGGAQLIFSPSSIRLEPGDYVRWKWVSGLHTTTSGASCVANGLWANNLTSTSQSFTRQFNEAPGSFPYFCSPHCGSGMVGTVLLTTPIQLGVTDLAPMAVLSWSGGAGQYRIYRADNALFNGATVLTPPGGVSGTSFNDVTGDLPAEGTAFFYLVMNQF
ncbi:MAG TPA: plastocyanin/azurin family copper-binding protein [Candidatus Polarisedimenticolia bacterium]|nr:plastocyanin/azurin family copper-binding protein [Candidatus Polarisedimenticolia bacterium]